MGPQVDAFEAKVAEYVWSKASLVVNSGTAALHLGLKALGVGQDDIVFCSDLTFSASCNPIIYQGAKPVFIDSEPESWNMSPQALRRAFEVYSPKAVIVVHLYGQVANIELIKDICDSHGVPILEDAAESLGATANGKQTGSFGRLGAFSFNGNKIITTSGGGMLLSDNSELIREISFLVDPSSD